MKRKTTARGYGWKHQQERRKWARAVAAAEALWWFDSSRRALGLGHSDDRTYYTGPEHRRCNVGAPNRARARRRRRFSRRW
jgi:hypothetical protein